MTQPEPDLRVRRTRKLLREALIELIEEHGFDTLSVGQITERALVSRAAFYRNYQDKYDLVEQIFAEAMQALLSAIAEPDGVHSQRTWERFFEHIAQYERLYRALLGRKGSPWFVWKMRAALGDLIKGFGQNSFPNVPPLYPAADEMVPDLIATLMVEAITWWLEQGRTLSTAEMTRRCLALSYAIFKETSTWA
jgi:AcrR family transcriptional regulator